MSDLDVRPRRRLGLAPAAPAPSRADRVAALRDDLARLDVATARERFALGPGDRLLKTTVSLCPECLAHVPGAVFARAGRVYLRKQCERHAFSDGVIENDERFYRLSNKDTSGRRYAEAPTFDIPPFQPPPAASGASCCAGGSCGEGTDQTANKTCTVLVEVTNACNLACPVCYSDARGDRKMPLATFRGYMERLIAQKGGIDSVQLTGGEALLHPEFWEMVAYLHAQPRVGKVYLPTNGVLLGREDVARRLVPFKDRLMVLLQFDGVTDATDRTLRAATPARARAKALELLARLGIHVQLTMTLARGVNQGEVGDVVATALRHENVKVVALQPATYSGRYDLEPHPTDRLTLSDVVKAVAAQSGAKVRPGDFVPIPCSHPNCGWITLLVRRFGVVANVARYVDLPRVVERVAYRTLLSTEQLRDTVGTARGSLWRRAIGAAARRLVRSTDVFTIAIKPFMDRHTYDQDRVAHCCHHLMDTSGNAVSFCEYNALDRPADRWDAFPLLSPA